MKKIDALLVFLLFFLIAISGCIEKSAKHIPPKCSLHALPSSGSAPLVVTFTLNASDKDGYITLWKFDADGDGLIDYNGTENELPKKIYYPYTRGGEYYPKLIVIDNDGLISNRSIHIHVCKQPLLKARPLEGYAPLKVTVYANLSDLNWNVSYWSIDFNGDGIPDYSGKNLSINLSHTYQKAGLHGIDFTVVGDCGGITTSVTIYVKNKEGNVPPYCSLEAIPSYGIAPLAVNFSIKGYDGDGYIVSWKLDVENDGIAEFNGSGSSANEQYTYEKAGTYLANLTVTDNKGATGFCHCKIVVNEKASKNHKARKENQSVLNYFKISSGASAILTKAFASIKWSFPGMINECNPFPYSPCNISFK